MKGILIYKGKYGATKQYAEWLSDSLDLFLYNPANLVEEQLESAEYVVIGSSVYIGQLVIKSWVQENLEILKNKKLFFFVVCATPDSEKEKQQTIIRQNIPAILLPNTSVYFLPGRLVIKDLSWRDRIMLRMGAFLEKDPEKKRAMMHDIDAVKRENLELIIESILHYDLGGRTNRSIGTALRVVSG